MQNGGKRTGIEWGDFIAGYCTQIEKITNKKKKMRKVQFPARFFLLKHPEKGLILVDTGYSKFFEEETKKFPYSLYSKITPILFDERESAKNQLLEIGIEISDIKYLFITHFHGDHIAGLRDFDDCKFICSKKAYDSVKDKKGIGALINGFVPNFIPSDFEKRVLFIEDGEKENDDNVLNFFGSDVYDVFGDGSLLSVELSGHAEGQMTLFFKGKNDNKEVFLVGDAAWDGESIKNLEYPSFITKLIASDYEKFNFNLKRLHLFSKKNPDILIIPTHCRNIEGDEFKWGR